MGWPKGTPRGPQDLEQIWLRARTTWERVDARYREAEEDSYFRNGEEVTAETRRLHATGRSRRPAAGAPDYRAISRELVAGMNWDVTDAEARKIARILKENIHG